MRYLVLALALAATAAAAQPRFAGEFALPTVLCDCDPIDFVFKTTQVVEGHVEPDPASPVVRRVDRGRLIEGNDWTETLTVVTRSAPLVVLADTVLTEVHVLGDATFDDFATEVPVETLALARGDTLAFLTLLEGFAWFRRDGVLYGTGSPLDEGTFRFIGEAQVATWFRLAERPGRPAAWVHIRYGEPDANVEMVCETHGGCR